MTSPLTRLGAALALAVGLAAPRAESRDARPDDAPRAHDPRLRVELFAAAPDIVHPINMDFDRRGRLLVIESHTHFRPPNYVGPPHDRVRVLEDTDGDGKADRFTTFFEGTQKTMDIAAHPDGSVYLATRNEILRLRDTRNDGVADEKRRVVFLDTRGDYPHNGLSGLCFDAHGDLYFGMGENLGAPYRLIGSDGTEIAGAGDGGHVFWCTADGRGLRRVATGFWNPFGICRDIFGRLFAVDNDPDAMPPCRLVHVVEGGDYGFQFRYGRAGRHPFQSWDGQLPGTLPMVAGTGEAPVEVVSYESDGLPSEYVGSLFVTAWADHRIERYVPRERGASLTADRLPFVQGGADFRPTGLAVAPDGSLFVGDWVLRDYNLHNRGAVWHVRSAETAKPDRPDDPRRALFSPHRPLRDAAARTLAAGDAGRDILRAQLRGDNVRARAASLTALLDRDDRRFDLAALAETDSLAPIRAEAVRGLVSRGDDTHRFLDVKYPPAVRSEAVGSLNAKADAPQLLQLLTDADPFLRHAAVRQLSRMPDLLASIDARSLIDPRQRIGLLLAYRAADRPDAAERVSKFLADTDDDVRLLAAKWASDEQLSAVKPQLVEALDGGRLNVRLHLAYATAAARIDGREVSEARLADDFVRLFTNDRNPPGQRAAALRLVPPTHRGLTTDLLGRLVAQDDVALRLEAVRTLCEQPVTRRTPVLRTVARNEQLDDTTRAQAIVGLAERSQDLADELLALARGPSPVLRDEALRALTGAKLTDAQKQELDALAVREPLVARVVGRPFVANRPAVEDLDAWLKHLDGPADAQAGRRVFFHPKLAVCARCHKAEGRGTEVGPDLSDVGRYERRAILESILRPSVKVAPQYQAWRVDTTDGKSRTGLLMNTNLDEYTYVDAEGVAFKVNTRDVTATQPLAGSLMPDGLADRLTDQELRDLLAYLCSLR
jgi:putative membrane-bound dehydrogenase-like protein